MSNIIEEARTSLQAEIEEKQRRKLELENNHVFASQAYKAFQDIGIIPVMEMLKKRHGGKGGYPTTAGLRIKTDIDTLNIGLSQCPLELTESGILSSGQRAQYMGEINSIGFIFWWTPRHSELLPDMSATEYHQSYFEVEYCRNGNLIFVSSLGNHALPISQWEGDTALVAQELEFAYQHPIERTDRIPTYYPTNYGP